MKKQRETKKVRERETKRQKDGETEMERWRWRERQSHRKFVGMSVCMKKRKKRDRGK